MRPEVNSNRFEISNLLFTWQFTWRFHRGNFPYNSKTLLHMCSRAMKKAFTLALCELSLWLLAGMEISKFAQFHGYLSSVSLRLQMDYPNTCLSWLTRQLDLELMFTNIISLRTANWIKWKKLFTDLLALSTGSTYSLALFIRFGGFIYRMYLLALFSGFIYSLAVFIQLGGSDHWIYLLDLFIGFIY